MNEIAESLYRHTPSGVLYHYTSLAAIQSILAEGGLWATDIHYFSDSAELGHTAALLADEIRTRLASQRGDRTILSQLLQWVRQRVANGHTLFVVSLSENGNLLSQWRSYCTYGTGISLGVSPQRLLACATEQGFSVAKCVYDIAEQRRVVRVVVDTIEAMGLSRGPSLPSQAHPSQSYYPVFAECEDAILRIAAVFKNPAFKEEAEWRVVSPVVADYIHTDIRYRPGRSTLVPYKVFGLAPRGGVLKLEQVFVGPTPHVALSINSLCQLLSRNGVNPMIVNSQVPYRET